MKSLALKSFFTKLLCLSMFGLCMVSCQKEEVSLMETEQVSIDDNTVYELELPNKMSEKEAVSYILNLTQEQIDENKQEVDSPSDYSLKNCYWGSWTTYWSQYLCNYCSGSRSAVRRHQYRLYYCNGDVFRWQYTSSTICNSFTYC